MNILLIQLLLKLNWSLWELIIIYPSWCAFDGNIRPFTYITSLMTSLNSLCDPLPFRSKFPHCVEITLASSLYFETPSPELLTRDVIICERSVCNVYWFCLVCVWFWKFGCCYFISKILHIMFNYYCKIWYYRSLNI